MNLDNPLEVIAPTTDAQVLHVLALSEQKLALADFCTLIPNKSRPGLRNTLHRLEAQGIVVRERYGNADAFELNREHLAAGAVLELARMKQTLKERVERAVEDFTVAPERIQLLDSDVFLVRPSNATDRVWKADVQALEVKLQAWTGGGSVTVVDALGQTAEEAVVEIEAEEASSAQDLEEVEIIQPPARTEEGPEEEKDLESEGGSVAPEVQETSEATEPQEDAEQQKDTGAQENAEPLEGTESQEDSEAELAVLDEIMQEEAALLAQDFAFYTDPEDEEGDEAYRDEGTLF